MSADKANIFKQKSDETPSPSKLIIKLKHEPKVTPSEEGHIMSNVTWRLYRPVEEATHFSNGGQRPAFKMTDIAWPTDMTVICQLDRYDEIEGYQLTVECDCKEGITYGHMLKTLYEFYNETPLTSEEVEMVKESMETSGDSWDYKKDALAKGKFNWIDLMGDCMFFQGIKMDDEECGILMLGS